MSNEETTEKHFSVNTLNHEIAVQRLTALWALSEAALGGVLHALKVPFTGLFVGSSAVIFITLIAFFSDKRGTILRSTFIVMIVKGIVSPHTPQTAYLAVLFQGVAGELIFFGKSYFFARAVTLGVLSLMQSALQKIIILTLVFGKNLWYSIDVLGTYILGQLSLISGGSHSLPISVWLISAYFLLHLAAGLFAGGFAGKIPVWITMEENAIPIQTNFGHSASGILPPKRKRRKAWWRRPSGILLFLLAAATIVLSYKMPGLNGNQIGRTLTMLIRSLLILFSWYFFVGPVFSKLLKSLLAKKRRHYGRDIEMTLNMLPFIKKLITENWHQQQDGKGLPKLKRFFITTLVLLLTIEIDEE